MYKYVFANVNLMIFVGTRLYMSVDEFFALDRSNPDVRYEHIDGMSTCWLAAN